MPSGDQGAGPVDDRRFQISVDRIESQALDDSGYPASLIGWDVDDPSHDRQALSFLSSNSFESREEAVRAALGKRREA
jgi:hypothetical protein